jgi:hypothetical protein
MKKKTKDKYFRGSNCNRLKNLNRYNRLKFKLDSDCLIKFRSLEGTRTVPSPIVTEMITALFNRNFEMDVDEVLVRKFAVQLLSMLGLIAIYNSDRKVNIDKVFQLHCYPHKMEDTEGGSKYVFSLRTAMKPKYLSSYLHQILFESENTEEIEESTVLIDELYLSYLNGLLNDGRSNTENT